MIEQALIDLEIVRKLDEIRLQTAVWTNKGFDNTPNRGREGAYAEVFHDYGLDILGDDSSSAIVGARNQRAIEVLRGQLDAGAQRIGIFYGVAHMTDLEDRLINELGLIYESTSWVDAWRLTAD